MNLVDSLVRLFAMVQDHVFERIVEPLLPLLGLMEYQEQAFDATEYVLIGIVEIVLMLLLFRPLEALFPAEHWSNRQPTHIDILYTLLHRLGFIPLVMFALMWPVSISLDGWLRLHGFMPFTLDNDFPYLLEHPLTTFVVYLVVLDFAGYWLHRFLHRLEWGWALHGVHHCQRVMSFWTDDRTHFLEDFLAAFWFSMLGLFIGLPPSQFVVLMMVTRILQSFAHANVAISFGRIGERLLVSPHYHRVHHGIGMGSESGPLSCNFAILFPIWDILFHTANFATETPPTGIADQLAGRNYGNGLLLQQWLGLERLSRALRGLKA